MKHPRKPKKRDAAFRARTSTPAAPCVRKWVPALRQGIGSSPHAFKCVSWRVGLYEALAIRRARDGSSPFSAGKLILCVFLADS